MFQIKNSENCPLTLRQIDKIAADFWKVAVNDETYCKPFDNYMDWFNIVGCSIDSLPKGEIPEWNRIIGKLCEVAAIGETNIADFYTALEYYKPYIELCFHFSKLGFVAVSC